MFYDVTALLEIYSSI